MGGKPSPKFYNYERDAYGKRVFKTKPTGRPKSLAVDRFWKKVDKESPDGHWLWKGKCKKTGYGIFSPSKGKTISAHRFAYEVVVGRVLPDHLTLQCDHVCSVKNCVRPGNGHVEIVTQRENLERYLRRRTHCKHGHDLRLPGVLKKGSKAACAICRRASINKCSRKIR